MQNPISLCVFLGLSLAVAMSGAFFGPGEWYRALEKPSWTPPGWLFGPVWTALYIMMAVAAWRVWNQVSGNAAMIPFAWYGAQLTLNALWSLLFFGMQRPDLALIDISLLLVAIVGTTLVFWRIDTAAGALFVPYLVWVSFATVLNASVWSLNST